MNALALLWISLAAVFIGFIVASFFLRRHRESAVAEAGWTSTSEVFIDPSTNRQMRVWVDEAGERHYVVEGRQPSS